MPRRTGRWRGWEAAATRRPRPALPPAARHPLEQSAAGLRASGHCIHVERPPPPVLPCSAQKKQEAVAAGVTAAAVAVMANPLAAEAAATPSLNNLIGSVFAGAFVLAAIAGAITAVS